MSLAKAGVHARRQTLGKSLTLVHAKSAPAAYDGLHVVTTKQQPLQTPVLVLSDLDIGMNDWVCPELKWDETYVPDRGKVLDAEQLKQVERFWRYYDHDNDGIPYRTFPGTASKGAYFARGSGHSQYGA